jgi:iron complex transport system substrate-binding protein
MAGGTNAYQDTLIQFPTISIEGLIKLDPDAIVEMVRDIELQSYSAEDIVAEWQTVPQLRAVKENRVYVLDGDHTTVPGPRFVLVLEDLARALHPEIDWDAP